MKSLEPGSHVPFGPSEATSASEQLPQSRSRSRRLRLRPRIVESDLEDDDASTIVGRRRTRPDIDDSESIATAKDRLDDEAQSRLAGQLLNATRPDPSFFQGCRFIFPVEAWDAKQAEQCSFILRGWGAETGHEPTLADDVVVIPTEHEESVPGWGYRLSEDLGDRFARFRHHDRASFSHIQKCAMNNTFDRIRLEQPARSVSAITQSAGTTRVRVRETVPDGPVRERICVVLNGMDTFYPEASPRGGSVSDPYSSQVKQSIPKSLQREKFYAYQDDIDSREHRGWSKTKTFVHAYLPVFESASPAFASTAKHGLRGTAGKSRNRKEGVALELQIEDGHEGTANKGTKRKRTETVTARSRSRAMSGNKRSSAVRDEDPPSPGPPDVQPGMSTSSTIQLYDHPSPARIVVPLEASQGHCTVDNARSSGSSSPKLDREDPGSTEATSDFTIDVCNPQQSDADLEVTGLQGFIAESPRLHDNDWDSPPIGSLGSNGSTHQPSRFTRLDSPLRVSLAASDPPKDCAAIVGDYVRSLTEPSERAGTHARSTYSALPPTFFSIFEGNVEELWAMGAIEKAWGTWRPENEYYLHDMGKILLPVPLDGTWFGVAMDIPRNRVILIHPQRMETQVERIETVVEIIMHHERRYCEENLTDDALDMQLIPIPTSEGDHHEGTLDGCSGRVAAYWVCEFFRLLSVHGYDSAESVETDLRETFARMCSDRPPPALQKWLDNYNTGATTG